LTKIRRIISYLYPLTYKINTPQNGVVELTYTDGKKILDSAHANYSYGSQKHILKFGLKKMDLASVNNVLLLGLGGGSVVQTLREDFHFIKKITAVDFDQTIIDIALNNFNLKNDDNLEVTNEDALVYVKNHTQKFDLIIVDLYIDDIVPSAFYTKGFWEDVNEIITKNGSFLFNACIFNENSEQQMHDLIRYLKESNSIEQFNYVENTNTVIVGKNHH